MSGYASRRGATTLVWFEEYPDMNQAISREKMLKKASRYIKIKMIEEMNPEWLDLYNSLFF